MRKKLSACLLSVILLTITLSVATANGGGSNYIIIIRDDYGVPHIFSNTKEGLGFGAGYAMAQDRLWQVDLYRRSAFGRLAEFGLATIDQDYATRSLGYSWEELGEMFNNWVPIKPEARLKEMFEAYLAGINLYIYQAMVAAAQGDLSLVPVEYLPGAVTPDGLLPIEPFSMEDLTAIIVMMAWRFGGTGGDELRYATALQALQAKHGDALGWAIFNDLYPQNDPGAEVTIPGTGSWGPFGWWHPTWWHHSSSSLALPSNIGDVYKEYEETKLGQTQLLESLGLPTKFGSNAWMVSPWKSKTRNAMQVGGPQMGHSIPQIVLEVGLHGAGINAVGMMMPHAPTILIGVSEYGAWTSTTGASDVMDTYIEVLNPANHTEYLYNGLWVPMEVRTERIYNLTSFEDRKVYRTVHGPVIAWSLGNNLAFTMKAPYYKNDLAAEEGWSLFQQARNIWEFQEAVKTIQPSHNFYWIDRRGNIGYWHGGTFPIKPTTGISTPDFPGGRPIDDRFPLWGTGEEEWVGLTGFAEMPKCINPKQGWLTNWNNKPIANWPYGESDVGWGEGHRVKRIMDVIKGLLAAKGKLSFGDMNRINIDAGYNHIPGMNFLHYLIEAAEEAAPGNPDVASALPYLKAWNHHYMDVLDPRYPDPAATYDDPGLTIFEKWYGMIDNEVFDDDLPPGVSAWDSTLIHVFDGEDSKLPLSYDYLNGEDRNTVIVRVLKWAIGNLTADIGSNMSEWLTPVRTVTFSQQGALPAPTMHYMNRGTYNHIAEMPKSILPSLWWWWRRPPRAVDVIPPGQSGFMNYLGEFNHAYDQLLLYETWTYKPMRFRIWHIWKPGDPYTILTYP